MSKFGFLVASMMATVACVSACGDGDADTGFTSAGAGGGSSGAAGKGNGGSNSSSGGSGSKAGSSNGGSPTGGSSAGGSDGEAGSVGAGGSDGGAPSAGGAGSTEGGAPGTGGAAACPDVFGLYDIASADGTCGSLNVDAMQEIAGTNVACFAHFVSTGDGPDGINGGAALDQSGNFEGAMLYLDTAQRNPCSGSWNAGAAEMTIECGGSGDLCTVVLERQ